MYCGYQRVDVDATVKDDTTFTIPEGTTYVELQADGANIKYTMDNATDPSGAIPRGMTLLTTEPARQFTIEDFLRIRFTQSTAVAGLNAHFIKGRNI